MQYLFLYEVYIYIFEIYIYMYIPFETASF